MLDAVVAELGIHKLSDERLGTKLRVTENRCVIFNRSTYVYLTVILRGRAGYELIYITNEAVGRVGYYQLISGKSEKNNCFSKFSSNPLDFFG